MGKVTTRVAGARPDWHPRRKDGYRARTSFSDRTRQRTDPTMPNEPVKARAHARIASARDARRLDATDKTRRQDNRKCEEVSGVISIKVYWMHLYLP
jgi:hypothetical protein